ncbi:MAG: hypothetical protein KGR18_07785, partial [Acidobacteria bacterium]|nr:hypothetical protein [Acidobacteriota bacterium]
QSALRLACNFPTQSNIPVGNTISDFTNAIWHNGAARAVTGIAFEGPQGSTLIYSPNAHFTQDDVNHIISGTIGGAPISAYSNVKIVQNGALAVLNLPATTFGVNGKTGPAIPFGGNGQSSPLEAKLENSDIRAGIGAVTVPNSSASVTGVTITKPNTGNATSTKTAPAWNAGDIGKEIVSTKLTGGRGFIVSVSSGTATLSTTATATATAQTVTVNTLGMVISPTLGFAATDVGRSITGTGLATGAKVINTGTVASGLSRLITGAGNPANGTDDLVGYTFAQVSGAVTQTSAILCDGAQTCDVDNNPATDRVVANPNSISVGADEIVSTTRTISLSSGSGFTIDAANGKISGPANSFRASDLGLPVGGCGVNIFADGSNDKANPPSVGQNYISNVSPNGSTITLAGGVFPTTYCTYNPANTPQQNAAAAAGLNAAGINVYIGLPSSSAPADGDVMSMVSSTLNLSPALVSGSDACNKNTYEGTTIMGQWYNPSKIGVSLTNGDSNQQSASIAFTGPLGISIGAIAAPSQTIGAIKYPTAVVSFWAFVTVRTQAETIGGKTFGANTTKISLPWVPTSLAMCAPGNGVTTGISSEYLFGGTSLGTQSVPTGTGRPSTALRGLRAGITGGDVAYQAQLANDSVNTFVGSGKFTAAGALGQGVLAKMALSN